MDMATLLPYLVQALGGAIGGNVLGALTRGGGGVVGRTLIGAIGGVGAAYAAGNVEAIGGITAMWGDLIEGENRRPPRQPDHWRWPAAAFSV